MQPSAPANPPIRLPLIPPAIHLFIVIAVRNGLHKNILVLGAVDKVVDELQDVGAVDTGFMWSPNNEQLAFVAGNDIQIYNFFGTSPSSVPRATAAAAATNSANLTDHNSFFNQFDFIK